MQSNRYRRYWPQQHPPALIMTQDPVTLARMAQMKTAYSFLSELFKGYVNERSLSIVSTADGSLTLHRRPVPHAYPPVPVPSSLPPHAIGALCTDKDCNTFGWVFAYAPLENIAPAAIGRLALIRLRDGTELIRFLKPAIRLGRFDLVPLSAARPFPDVEILAATPILFIQT